MSEVNLLYSDFKKAIVKHTFKLWQGCWDLQKWINYMIFYLLLIKAISPARKVIKTNSLTRCHKNKQFDTMSYLGQFRMAHILKRKFKQSWLSIPPISTKCTVTSDLNWTHWTQNDHDLCRLKSRFWLGTGLKMWRSKNG